MAQPIDLILMGAGARGADSYAPYALEHPDQARFVAVAEPDATRRERFAQAHNIPAERCFVTWQDLLAARIPAQAALVCTQDQMHVEPALAAMDAGYDVLLEKPISPSLAECVQLVQGVERTGRTLQICHVLRYTQFFSTLHEIIASGRLGEVITVEHRENVAYWHMAHSYVRGNWRNTALSSPMILAKCCHDLDIITWNMLGKRCTHLSSVGSLMHYRSENAGPEIPARCTDGCPIEKECKFSAVGTYLEFRPFPKVRAAVRGPIEEADAPREWPFTVLSPESSYEARRQALETGPYGRCVYRSDNDVVDQQVVSMEFEGGASVVLFMHGHSYDEYRSMRYDGTKATLIGTFTKDVSTISIHDHGKSAPEVITLVPGSSGHGGGDFGIMQAFLRALHGEEIPMTGARMSLESHLMAFAAEEARLGRTVVDMAEFRARAEALTR